ncbi:MAG: MFS transporter [Defluviitaleaceae bacterium]|nr:MFS transporter [Defluviitaleaceae bacterium]MCL2238499.1 MFS transporter [Defluviitaleaceae bacterium]
MNASNKLSFYLIVVSQGIGLIGGEVLYFAISLHVLDLTGSAEIFAAMIAISFLPRIIFTPLGGAMADRFSKKMILVICDSANTILVGVLALLLLGGSQSVILLGAAVTLITLISTFYHPTVTASLPAVRNAGELVKANGLVQGIKAVSRLLGPIMAGFLFAAMGVTFLVGLCALFFLFSAIINFFIKIPHQKQARESGMVKTIAADIKEGFVYITRTNPVLFRIAMVFTVFILFYQSMLAVAFPYMLRITFAMSEASFGFANAGIGVAVLAGSLISGKIKKYMEIKHLPYYIALIGAFTAPIALSMLLPMEGTPFPPLLMISSFMLIMFIFTLINVLIMAYTQIHVPSHMVGKTIALILSIVNLSAPVGLFLLGWLLENMADAQFIIYFAIALFTLTLGLVAKRFVM